jgi:hypothetical protein
MDVLAKITDTLVGYAAGLSPETIQFWLRLVCLLMLPAGTCAWSFLQGHRSVFVQVLAAVFGLLLALSLPLENARFGSGLVRLWFLTFALVLAAFMPAALPFLLLPTIRAQRRLRAALYFTVGVLILANLIWRPR